MPHTSRPQPEHRIYPYLLRGVDVSRPDGRVAIAKTINPETMLTKEKLLRLHGILEWKRGRAKDTEESAQLDALIREVEPLVSKSQEIEERGTPREN